MQKTIFFISLVFLISCQGQKNLEDIINSSFELAAEQYKEMDKKLTDSLLPRSIHKGDTMRKEHPKGWTSGFYPASLWYLHEFSNDAEIKQNALKWLKIIENQQFQTYDHDIGFQIFCPYGNALRITGDASYKRVIINAAKSLTTRFDTIAGCIRSWGKTGDTAEYKVIVDNMMNLELLFWAAKETGDSTFFNIAVSHADKTMKEHYRPDGSSYHLVSYDPATGKVQYKKTVQGYADESAWARGQSWGLYGYTMSYRETGYKRYLDHAVKIANFLVNHPNLPADKIPFWDFDVPEIPNTERDASAGAIMASALIELSQYVNDSLETVYLNNAKTMIGSLSSKNYRSKAGKNHNFLIMHCVGNYPNNSEIDVPLVYADYYYLEAMLRYMKLVDNKTDDK